MLIGGKDFLDVYRMRFAAIQPLHGVELIASLSGWIKWLRSSPPSAEVLSEILSEVLAEVPKYAALCAEIEMSLAEAADDVAAATPDLERSIQERRASPELLEGARALKAALKELEERGQDPKLPSAWTLFPESPDAAFAYLVSRIQASSAFADKDVRLAMRARVQDAQWNAQAKFASLMLRLAAGGGHSFAVFDYLVGCVGVGSGGKVPLQNAGMPSSDPVRSIMAAVFGPQEVAPHTGVRPDEVFPRGLRQWEPLFRRHSENLYREILFRLTERRHYTTALLRYGVRAERYDRERLRKLVESNAGQVEAVLAADCAKYLFDCGFDVSTEFVLGNVRADIVAPDLYVEAKQVGDADGAKTKVLAGYRQTLGSARRLRDRPGGVPPLALVVFLVGGTRIEAPEVVPAWQHSPAVRIHVVDLRIEEQGARERPPIRITVEELQRMAKEEEADH